MRPIPGDHTDPAATNWVVPDDARDVAAARAGDQAAFARLYDRHAPVVLSLCRRRTLTDAEDATQETFIRAFRRLDRLESAEKIRPWLYSIARRVCSERRRAAMRRHRHEEQATMSAAVQSDPQPTALDTASQEDQLEMLTRAMDDLDERQRLALHLYYLEADPVRAAGEQLGLSRSGYYKLLSRARECLAAIMRQEPVP